MSDGCVEVAQPPPPSVSRPSVEARTTAHGRAWVARRVTTPRPLCASWPAQVVSHAQCLGRGCGAVGAFIQMDSVGSPRAEVDGAGWRARSRRWSRALSCAAIVSRSAVVTRRVSWWASVAEHRSARSQSQLAHHVHMDSVCSPRAVVDGAGWRARSLVGGRARSHAPRSSLGAPSSHVASHGGRAQHPPLSSGVRRRPTGGDREGDAARAAPAASPRRAQQLPTRVSGKQMRQAQHPAHPPGVRSNSPRGVREEETLEHNTRRIPPSCATTSHGVKENDMRRDTTPTAPPRRAPTAHGGQRKTNAADTTPAASLQRARQQPMESERCKMRRAQFT